MRVTRENIQEFIALADELIDALNEAKDAAETWDDLQDAEKSADTAEEIRGAREELDNSLETIDATGVCQLLHGKHKGAK